MAWIHQASGMLYEGSYLSEECSTIISDYGTNFVGARNQMENVDWPKLKNSINRTLPGR